MAHVIAAIPDIFFRAKVLETAKTLSVNLDVARGNIALAAEIAVAWSARA